MWKYMDDTTLSENISALTSKMQEYLDHVKNWSDENQMNINSSKTKEMIIDSKKLKSNFHPLKLGTVEIERVDCIKVLGLNITNNLKWNTHVEKITSGASKKIFNLKQLKRSGMTEKDLVLYYKTVIRPAVEYACQVWHTSLTNNFNLRSQEEFILPKTKNNRFNNSFINYGLFNF